MKRLIKLPSWILRNFVLFILSSLFISTILGIIIGNIYVFLFDPMNKYVYIVAEITVTKDNKHYEYNDQVPIEVIKTEIIKQAKAFGNNEKFMLALADCESTFNNLADNPTSTAKGAYQFIAQTWEATESNRKHISPFDYKANIKEANIKIANKEYSHWKPVCIK